MNTDPAPPATTTPDTEVFPRRMAADDVLGPIVARAAAYRFQVLLSLLPPRGETGPLRTHAFRADAEYFYPASTVKLPVALAALERLGDPDAAALGLDERSPMTFDPCYPGELPEESDPSNRDGATITIGHDARHSLIVSDNTAHNRLTEFLGFADAQRRIRRAGLPSVSLRHRLSEPHTPEDEGRTPRVTIRGSRGTLVMPARHAMPEPPLDGVAGLDVGVAHIADGQRIERPMSMRTRNRVGLADLHRLIIAVGRPDLPVGVDFRLAEPRRALAMAALRQFPRESDNPALDPAWNDDFVKPFLPGLRRALGDRGLTMHNKIGWAYGFFTDTALVEPAAATHRPFALTATMFVCASGVVNNDEYQYEQLARPVFAAIARLACDLAREP